MILQQKSTGMKSTTKDLNQRLYFKVWNNLLVQTNQSFFFFMCLLIENIFKLEGCSPGSRVPSPYDNCNTCTCGEDGSIGACTRISCTEGN